MQSLENTHQTNAVYRPVYCCSAVISNHLSIIDCYDEITTCLPLTIPYGIMILVWCGRVMVIAFANDSSRVLIATDSICICIVFSLLFRAS